jgi:hypothetical protein
MARGIGQWPISIDNFSAKMQKSRKQRKENPRFQERPWQRPENRLFNKKTSG